MKPFIGVNYKEFEADTYWGVEVSDDDGKLIEVFFSGNFDVDYEKATLKYPDHFCKSSVTQFISDVRLRG